MTQQPVSARRQAEAKRAINGAMDLLNRRWTLRILWELRADAMNFRELRTACGELSMSVLNTRLTELRAARLISHEAGSGYALTGQGLALMQAMRPMLAWAQAWAAELQLAGVDDEVLGPLAPARRSGA